MTGSPPLTAATVAIIGAGPSGLAAARYFLAEGQRFDKIHVYEQRPRVGGVWDYDPGSKHRVPGDLPLPQHSTHWDVNSGRSSDDLIAPLYDDLETNIPRGLMGFSDLDWPRDTQLFPRHEDVLAYIRRYADPVLPRIRFRTKVTDLRPASATSPLGWHLTTLADDGSEAHHHYDAVVVATGHFAVPFVPAFPGLEAWSAQHPGTISHSLFYKSPAAYAGQKVLVIGNGASGTDIAGHLLPHVSQPLLLSSRSESYFPPADGVQPVAALSSLDPERRTATFANGSVSGPLDAILFCTGYLYSHPFLSTKIARDGPGVTPLYKHLFLRDRPSLAFLALQQRVIPFPLAEAQAAVLSRVWSGRAILPSAQEMESWETEHLAACERPKDVHVLGFPADADYINEMHDWAEAAGEGKLPLRWGPRERWLRERFQLIKRAFAAQGAARRGITTVEELGFDFDAWKREQAQLNLQGHEEGKENGEKNDL